MGGLEGLGALQAVALTTAATAAAARLAGGDGVGASMHHDGVHAVGHGEGAQVGLDGHREGQLVDEVDRGAGDYGATAEVLEAEDWGHKGRGDVRKELSTQITIFDLTDFPAPPDLTLTTQRRVAGRLGVGHE